jgi:hypothetical protein
VYLFFIFFGLAIMLLQLVVEAVAIARVIARERRVRTFCLRGTANRPELALSTSRRHHLFLSRARHASHSHVVDRATLGGQHDAHQPPPVPWTNCAPRTLDKLLE